MEFKLNIGRTVKVYLTKDKGVMKGRLLGLSDNYVIIKQFKHKIAIIPSQVIVYIEVTADNITSLVKGGEQYTNVNVDGTPMELPINQDYFEENYGLLTNLVRMELMKNLMYINDRLFISKEDAVKEILSQTFPMKVNGREINSIDDLLPEESSFIGGYLDEKVRD